MEPSGETLLHNNDSIVSELPLTKNPPPMDPVLYEVLLTLFGYLCIAVGLYGIVANILIIITYVKIGINSSINTSYTAMAISDLGCIITTIGFEYLTIPHVERSGILPIVCLEMVPIIGYPNMAFSKITSCITAYIALERCLCVAFPHKVKLFFTKRVTMFIVGIISIVCTIPTLLVALIYKLEWKTSPTFPNKTVLGVAMFVYEESFTIHEFTHYMYGIILQWVPLIITFVCSIFLIVHLNAGSKWRLQSANTDKNVEKNASSRSNKEDRIVKAVLAISILSIVFSTPLSTTFALNMVDDKYIPFSSKDMPMNDVRGTLGTMFHMFNSCFNIFIYYNLGSKFRSVLREMFGLRRSEMGESG